MTIGKSGLFSSTVRSAVIAASFMAFTAPAFAQQITIADSTNSYKAGIGPNGELYDSNTHVGFVNPAGQDYILPGTPRDSWGIASSAGSAYADYQNFGTAGITGTSITPGLNSATAISMLANGIQLTQTYNFFAPNILSIQEFITNTTNAAISNVIFRRNVDFDVPPTAFNENIFGVLGSNSAVVGNSNNGFENPDPTNPFTSQCGASCNLVGDLGVGIDLGLGTINAGSSATFAYYYGINQPGQNLNGLFSQAQGLGLNYLIGAQSSENGQYPGLGSGSGFLGVSSIGTIAGAVPEPATWGLMILGFGFVGAGLRRANHASEKRFNAKLKRISEGAIA